MNLIWPNGRHWRDVDEPAAEQAPEPPVTPPAEQPPAARPTARRQAP